MKQVKTWCIAWLAAASVASANPLNWKWVDVSSLPPRGPIGGATTGPTNVSQTSPPVDPQPGNTYYYMVDNGANTDSNGGGASHFDIEGIGLGSFAGQSWLRWDGLNTFKTDADAAFGTGEWTIRRVWLSIDEASFAFGNTAGCVAIAEVSGGLGSTNVVADWAKPGSCSQIQLARSIPIGFRGYTFTATAGGASNQSFLIYDGSDANFPIGSSAFTQLTCGDTTKAVQPVATSFSLYLVPNNDYSGGGGANVALSFDGFLAGSFGYSPMLVFEVAKRSNNCTANHIPVAANAVFEAPFSATPGQTCSFTISATDDDGPSGLTFSTAGGTLGGSLTLVGAPIHSGNTYTQSVTYTIPANARGRDAFTFKVNDGGNDSNTATLDIVVRGDAAQNAVAFGANVGDIFDSMRVYNGTAAPNGGTELNRLVGPGFAQSCEFDNLGGVRHNPTGHLLALDFGAPPAGPGTLQVYDGSAACGKGGSKIFTFDIPSVSTGPARVVGLSVSPDNTRLAVFGTNTFVLYILNYNAATDPPTVALDHEISLASIVAAAKTIGTTWLDNDHVLIVDPDGAVDQIEVSTSSISTLAFSPRLISSVSVADIEYNPEVSPYVFVSIGEFASDVTTNTLYVIDTTGNVIDQGGGQTYTDYSNSELGSGDETFREIGMDCAGNLFIGTFVNNTRRVNIKYLPNAANVASIAGGAGTLVSWRTLTPAEATSNFSGLDVAASTTIGSTGSGCGEACELLGDMNHDGHVNGADIQAFTGCMISAAGGPAPSGCACANVDSGSNLDTADVTAFVGLLLN